MSLFIYLFIDLLTSYGSYVHYPYAIMCLENDIFFFI